MINNTKPRSLSLLKSPLVNYRRRCSLNTYRFIDNTIVLSTVHSDPMYSLENISSYSSSLKYNSMYKNNIKPLFSYTKQNRPLFQDLFKKRKKNKVIYKKRRYY